ncbi:hypothetical protein [Aquimarina sp. AU58]|uniref:hypothetical protein n=1 Tax=Aquimarina sp. AU58 TaxID=1874112 RepID=UPI0013591711|nr:hypothetical protein [Aquimarina sp. AU58]
MMKITSILIILICFTGCKKKNVQKINQEETSQNNIKKDKMKNNVYFLNYDFEGYYEIFFNGISVTRNYESGVSNGFRYLNPLISSSGEQIISINYKKSKLKENFSAKLLKDVSLEIFMSETGQEPPFKLIKKCVFPEITNKSIDSISHSWVFNSDVSYNIRTLQNAKKISSEDSIEIIKDVLQFYKKVHAIVNNAKTDDFLSLYKKSHDREIISMGLSKPEISKYLTSIVQRVESSAGFMQPIKDYELKIHPNGKIITLENSIGKTPLYSEDNNGNIKTYGLMLIKNSDGELEVY